MNLTKQNKCVQQPVSQVCKYVQEPVYSKETEQPHLQLKFNSTHNWKRLFCLKIKIGAHWKFSFICSRCINVPIICSKCSILTNTMFCKYGTVICSAAVYTALLCHAHASKFNKAISWSKIWIFLVLLPRVSSLFLTSFCSSSIHNWHYAGLHFDDQIRTRRRCLKGLQLASFDRLVPLRERRSICFEQWLG